MNVDFITAIKIYFANYVNFRGRSTRAEYWWAMLFVFLLYHVVGFFEIFLYTLVSEYVSAFVLMLVSLGLLLPTLAVTTRRMHDIGKSGWWVGGFYVVPMIILGIMFKSWFHALLIGVTGPISVAGIIIAPMDSGEGIGGIIVLLVFYICMLVFLVKSSAPDNKYGPCPYGSQILGSDDCRGRRYVVQEGRNIMNIGFITAIKIYFANYVNFRGRSTRAEYWWAMLFVFLLPPVLFISIYTFISILVSLALILPTLAVTTRRMHDIGKSGWCVVGFYLVPVLVVGVCFRSLFVAILEGVTDPVLLANIAEASPVSLGIGALVLLAIYIYMFVLLVKPSAPDNQYGPCPYGSQILGSDDCSGRRYAVQEGRNIMNIGFITAIKIYFANYVNFRGRSTRAEYWWAMLFVFLLYQAVGFFSIFLYTLVSEYVSAFVLMLVSLALLLPTLAVTTRRMHDIGKSGWWVVGFYVFPMLVILNCFSLFFVAILEGVTDPVLLANIAKASPVSLGIGALVLLVFYIYMLVLLVKPSAPDNQYGPCHWSS